MTKLGCKMELLSIKDRSLQVHFPYLKRFKNSRSRIACFPMNYRKRSGLFYRVYFICIILSFWIFKTESHIGIAKQEFRWKRNLIFSVEFIYNIFTYDSFESLSHFCNLLGFIFKFRAEILFKSCIPTPPFQCRPVSSFLNQVELVQRQVSTWSDLTACELKELSGRKWGVGRFFIKN